MVDPINYSGMLTQIDLSPLQGGLRLRANNRAQEAEVDQRNAVTQLAREKFTYDQEKDAEYAAAIEAYRVNPDPEILRHLGLRFPDKSEELRKAGESYADAARRDMLGSGFGALGALSAGKPDVAIKTLQDRVTALKGSGIDTSHTQAAIDMIKAGDTKGATAYLSFAMAGLVGEDHAASVMETLGIGGKAEDRRADNARADRAADIAERRVANSERATDAAIARGDAASARAERAADRADRKSAGGGGGYEYRIVNGALQRRKVR